MILYSTCNSKMAYQMIPWNRKYISAGCITRSLHTHFMSKRTTSLQFLYSIQLNGGSEQPSVHMGLSVFVFAFVCVSQPRRSAFHSIKYFPKKRRCECAMLIWFTLMLVSIPSSVCAKNRKK